MAIWYGGTVAYVRFKLRGLRLRLPPGGIYGMYSSSFIPFDLLCDVGMCDCDCLCLVQW